MKNKCRFSMTLSFILVLMMLFATAIPCFAADNNVETILFVYAPIAEGSRNTTDRENGVMGPGDKAVVERLESLGYMVKAVVDADSTSEDAEGCVLIYLAESLEGSQIKSEDGTALKWASADTSKIPIIYTEPRVFELQGMVAETHAYSILLDKNMEFILDTENDIVKKAGLGEKMLPYDASKNTDTKNGPIELVNIGKGASIVATCNGKPVMVSYDIGSELYGGKTSAARMVYFYPREQHADMFSEDSWKLFDAMIEWCLEPYNFSTTVLFVYAPVKEGTNEVNRETGVMGPGDKAVVERLESLGYTVKAVVDNVATTQDAEGCRFVYVAETVQGANVRINNDTSVKWAVSTSKIPVIYMKPTVEKEGEISATHQGVAFDANMTFIVDNDHDIIKKTDIKDSYLPYDASKENTGGSKATMGPVTLGTLGAGAKIVASVNGAPVMVTYDVGASLYSDAEANKALARMVYFYPREQYAEMFSDDSWEVFDAMVEWIAAPAVEQGNLFKTVNNVEAGMFTEPNVNTSPRKIANIADTAKYTGSAVKWTDADGETVKKVAYGATITATITLTPVHGYIFTEDTVVDAQYTSYVINEDGTLTVTRNFTTEAAPEDDTTPSGGDDVTAPSGGDDVTAPSGGDDVTTPSGGDDKTSTDDKKGGCSGTVVSGAVVVALVCAAAVSFKKKED